MAAMRTYDIVEHNGDHAPLSWHKVELLDDREFDDRAAELMPDPTKHYSVTASDDNGFVSAEYKPARGASA